MKAAIYQGKEKIVIQDIPKPVPKKGEALIKVKYAGICGSDLEFFKTGLWPGRGVLGHEVTGTIAELGSEVKKWKEGDRVSIDCTLNCGKCVFCQKGYTNLCRNGGAIGLGHDGGFAEYLIAPYQSLVHLPDSIPDKYGTVFDQIGTDLIALREANFIIGNSAAVLGLGTLGIFMLQCLKVAGASKVVVVDKNPHRLEIAERFKPDRALSKLSLHRIRKAYGKEINGADFVFECSGVSTLINGSLDIVRRGGTIVQIGICDSSIETHPLKYTMNHNKIQGILGYLREDFETAVDLVARKLIDPEPVVTKIVPLDDIVEEGFKEAINPETKEVKILVEP
jgi:(R,R)-butanediol dehydrogenase/meso-butanediol dehydrogenase/diacetyl reductase